MNSLPSDLDYNIIAGKGTAGSLAIPCRWPSYLLYGNRGFFSPRTPLFFEFQGPRPGLKKDPLFLEIGNDHAYRLTWWVAGPGCKTTCTFFLLKVDILDYRLVCMYSPGKKS